jgi:Capsule polysaccharide biosynthesis protein
VTEGDAPARSVRGRVLDWAWNHPRSKRRLREAWGIGREAVAKVGLPRPFDPPDWAALRSIAASADPPATDAERVLFMSWRGWSTHLAIETVLAHAVLRRGGAPIFAYCGGRLPICDVMPVDAAPPMPCHSCREYAAGAIEAAGFESVALHDVLDVRASVSIARKRVAGLSTVAECAAYVDQGLPLGQLVRVSVAWFLSRGTLSDTPQVIDAYRSFLVSGIVVARGLRAILKSTGAQRIFMLNGTFFAESIMSALAAQRGLPFSSYEKGFIHDSIVLTPGAPASHLKMPPEAWEEARDTPLSDDESAAIDAYLGARRSGGGSLDNFWRDRVEDADRIHRELQLAAGRPLVVMFCNILWDSAVLGRDIAFESMGDWVLGGIRWAQSHPDVDLVVRIHPAEVGLRNHPTRERMADHIAAHISSLPANVRVVQADDPTSSYVFMDEATLGLVYTSTVGLELAARGVPVVVAADTHYRGRGFTIDPVTPDEYWLAADRLLSSPPDDDERTRIRELARRYAVLFFFRFHNVLDAVTEEGRSRPRIRIASAAELDPGHNAAMDRVAAGMLDGITPIAPPGTNPYVIDSR